ncbi:MAG: NAD(+)/NADH kinase [Deltaproteobacteria bacterium]|nr:NAD(+)/NADH kinase [Deltaproteobacteria bacterium]
MKSIKIIGIIVNSSKQNAMEQAERLRDWLSDRGVKAFLETDLKGQVSEKREFASSIDMVVVFGGDGTLLVAARIVKEYDVPILGIKLGGLGFMTVINLNEIYNVMDIILRGDYTTSRRMMLNASVEGTECSVLNDIVISRSDLSRMVNLETFVDEEFLATFKADGLIISTPTGSTAYSMSAGGPIVFPENDSIIINPICPHTLTNRPIVLPPESTIKVRLTDEEEGVKVAMDGQVLNIMKSDQEITIKKSQYFIDIVDSPFRGYLEVLRTKLGWGGSS